MESLSKQASEPCLRSTLQRVTEDILDQMQRSGWYLEDSLTRSFDRPVSWDINCGWCREWAELAAERTDGVVAWVEDLIECDEPDSLPCHAVLKLAGRYYDSQSIDGVVDARDLPLMKGISRAQHLESASGGDSTARRTYWLYHGVQPLACVRGAVGLRDEEVKRLASTTTQVACRADHLLAPFEHLALVRAATVLRT